MPGALVMAALAWIAAAHGSWGPVAAAFALVKPVVVAIVLHALWRIGRRALTAAWHVALALAAFGALAGLHLPFPLVILAAGIAGVIAVRLKPHKGDAPAVVVEIGRPGREGRRLALLLGTCVVLWLVPVALAVAALGADPFAGVAALFTKAAFVTFGGAYAVLPYIAEAGVHHYGWLSPADMANGLALAETTPGPLILVTQYVGFFAGWNAGGGSLALALAAAALTTWVTFLPCFLFILATAPHLQRLTANPSAAGALAAITAAVVGVIANLALFLARIALLHADGAVSWPGVALALVALGVLMTGRVGLHWLVLGAALLGAAGWLVGLPL